MNEFLKYFNLNTYPYGFWNDIENVKLFLRFVVLKLNYTSIEDWYTCTRDQLENLGGTQMFNKYKNLINILNLVYENKYNFLEWKFVQISQDLWCKEKIQLKYMHWLYEKLNFNSIEDWYKVDNKTFRDNEGRGLLSIFKESTQNILTSIFKDYNWLPWKFSNLPRNFTNKENNLKSYMNWLYEELIFDSIEDWYSVTQDTFYKNHGSFMLQKFNGSPYKIITSIFKEYEWLPWKFIRTPIGFWNKLSNQRKYLDWLFEKLNFKNKEDWYNINQVDFIENHGQGFINMFGGHISIIIKNYPELELEKSKFNILKGEFKLYTYIKEITNNEISSQVKFFWCKNPETKCYLPFDFHIEDLKIIIELDGQQHFEQLYNWELPEITRKRDKYKMEKANENGYTVIRLLWDDVYHNKNNWKSKLKESFKFYESPTIIYLNDKYKDFY